MSEKLSALVDNELEDVERARVLRDLGRDAELAGLWSRYHTIGLAMRREQIVPNENLPERVARGIERETGAAGVLPGPRRRGSLRRPAGGFAIAASVAGVLLVGGLIVKLYEDMRPAGANPPAAQQIVANEEAMRWEDADPRIEDALNALLIEHGEFTTASGMNGLTAYTKFVAYDSR